MNKKVFKQLRRQLGNKCIRQVKKFRQRKATNTTSNFHSYNGAEQLGDRDLNSAKVLFLRQNAIGDAIISTPVFVALKAHYPDITIDVLLNRRNRTVYDNDANIRRTYVIKMRPLDIVPIIRLIRRERYDYVVDLVHSPSTTSSLICLLSGASITVGGIRERPDRYPSEDEVYDVKIKSNAQPGNDRMLLRLAECLSVFGIDPAVEKLRSNYVCRDEAQVFAESLLERVKRSPSDLLAGINISGSKAYKYWGTDKFIALLKDLIPRYPGTRFVVLYSADYQQQAEAICEASGATLSGGTPTLDSFAAVIARLDYLITTDSAAVHFADVARVPTVTMTIDPEGHDLWCPTFSRYRVVHAPDENLGNIKVATVLSAVEEIFASSEHCLSERVEDPSDRRIVEPSTTINTEHATI